MWVRASTHVGEGIDLRPALPVDASIYVLHGPHPGAELECVVHGLVPVLNSLPQLGAWRGLANGLGKRLPAILQVDSGMARLGLAADELDTVASTPDALQGLDLRFIMSHLASAEDQGNPANRVQLERFRAALPELPCGAFRRQRRALRTLRESFSAATFISTWHAPAPRSTASRR